MKNNWNWCGFNVRHGFLELMLSFPCVSCYGKDSAGFIWGMQEKRPAQQKRCPDSPPVPQRSLWEAPFTLIFSFSIYLPPSASSIYWLVLDRLWPPRFIFLHAFKHKYKCSHSWKYAQTGPQTFQNSILQLVISELDIVLLPSNTI